METRVPTAVLVVTTLPEQRAERARVLSTQDVSVREELEAVVDSLTALLAVVEAWWIAYWRLSGAADDANEERGL